MTISSASTRFIRIAVSTLIAIFSQAIYSAAQKNEGGWPAYGGDIGGSHYSSSGQITRDNVKNLRPAWTYHTGAFAVKRLGDASAAFETTPVLFHDTLYLTTQFAVVKALDPATGKEKWSFSATDNSKFYEGGLLTNRGVATWEDPATSQGICHARILFGTLDARLIAIDADTGKPCEGFGTHGEVTLQSGGANDVLVGTTSAPTIIDNVVVVGSTMGDNYRVRMPTGTVRGYDIYTGKQLWSWNPIAWSDSEKVPAGGGNVWSTISADPALHLVYLPTSSPSPDYFAGMRPGDNKDADSVVALDPRTGKKVWAFQLVHHNVWDYDVAAEPLLFTLHGKIPAVAVTTKMGMVFVLDRRTGAPLYPVEERPVPQDGVPGEVLSPTQPFSSLPALLPLTKPTLDTDSSGWKRSPQNEAICRKLMDSLQYEGVFTPPTIGGSLINPGNIGGVNWGGPAIDPVTNVLYANTNRVPYAVRLIRRADVQSQPWDMPPLLQRFNYHLATVHRHPRFFNVVFSVLALCILFALIKMGTKGRLITLSILLVLAVTDVYFLKWRARVLSVAYQHSIDGAFYHDTSPMLESPYSLVRDPLRDGDGNPCIAPPWGAVTALDLEKGTKLWERPLGTRVADFETGSDNLGGPIATGGGLLFDAATREPLLRAFDQKTGEKLWEGALPVPAQATPMTYTYQGTQYVVIAAGGHGLFKTKTGDSVVAFALK